MGDEENLQLTEFENAAANIAEEARAGGGSKDLDAVYDVPVQVSAVLGRASMQVSQLLKLGRGAVVELDRKVGEAVDIYVNNRLVARGEVVVVEDRLGVTMTEIIKTDRGAYAGWSEEEGDGGHNHRTERGAADDRGRGLHPARRNAGPAEPDPGLDRLRYPARAGGGAGADRSRHVSAADQA